MKRKLVHIVMCSYFEDTSIDAVFIKEADAVARVVELNDAHLLYHFYHIEEHELQ